MFLKEQCAVFGEFFWKKWKIIFITMFFFSVKSRNTDSSCVIISLESALFICIGQILYTLYLQITSTEQ